MTVRRSYWGAWYCAGCARVQADIRDAEGTWPKPWWEHEICPTLAVVGREGIYTARGWLAGPVASIEALGALGATYGLTQIWVHESGLGRLGLPERLPHRRPKDSHRGVPHPFTDARGEWAGGARPGLKGWGYWYRKGGHGFDLTIPAYTYRRDSPEQLGDPWRAAFDCLELAHHVSWFTEATRGLVWKGTGALTSDVWLRKRLGDTLAPTEAPEPVERRLAAETHLIWHRPLDRRDSGEWCHALDLNLAYAGAASSLELPTGECRRTDWPGQVDERQPGVWLVEGPSKIPGVGEKARWVTTPTAAFEGLEPIEGYIWPAHGRRLRAWYEMIRDARLGLLDVGGPALQALKAVCREGLGRLASVTRSGDLDRDPSYQPYWDWAVIAESRNRLLRRIKRCGIHPVAIDVDCLYVVTDHPRPDIFGALVGLPMGEGLGQFKSGGTCAAEKVRPILDGRRTSQAIIELRDAVHA